MHLQTAVEFAGEVREGLLTPGQKSLPAKYLYDDVGSALFDAITALPEYGLTRADLRLLTAHARDIAALCPGTLQVAELGSGNGSKARVLLSAFGKGVTYRPIDLSRAALESCRRELAEFDVSPIHADFLEGLEIASRQRRGRLMVAFLGSNIGNFQRDEIAPFLRSIRDRLLPGDTLLIGADLLKPVADLILAYDDPAGVTAAFNKNLLSRLNREFEGDFDVRRFDHEVRWNPEERRIEMHLRAGSDQTALLRALDLRVKMSEGETIWTESSHKFEVSELTSLARRAGFAFTSCWSDQEWPFAELLYRAE